MAALLGRGGMMLDRTKEFRVLTLKDTGDLSLKLWNPEEKKQKYNEEKEVPYGG